MASSSQHPSFPGSAGAKAASAPDTIAAIATAPGAGALAVVRVSGSASQEILTRLFKSASPAFKGFKPRFMHYGHILAAPKGAASSAGIAPAPGPGGRVIDEVLAVFMPGPATFTGEDIAEIHGHGGPAVAAAVLDAVLDAGARLAEPGEFTRRAFLNGRLDLSQAEAVAECIAATSAEALKFAQVKLDGLLGARVRELRERLRRLCAQLTVAVDFPEEDVEILPREALTAEIAAVLRACADLDAGYARAKLMRQGALVVLAGQVNVGKSSLLNALLGRERAIVTPHPGTTRDFLEETIDLDGLPVRLVDTAGLRQAHDPVEEEGLRKARELMTKADLVLWVISVEQLEPATRTAASSAGQASKSHAFRAAPPEPPAGAQADEGYGQGPQSYSRIGSAAEGYAINDVEHDPSDRAMAAEADALAALAPGKIMGVLNKIDLRPPVRAGFDPLFPANTPAPGDDAPADTGWLEVSARTGQGLEELAAAVRDRLLGNADDVPAREDSPVPNLRQHRLLLRAAQELKGLLTDAEAGIPYDLLGVRAETAGAILAEITGEITSDDVLDLIFAEFCLGK